MIWGDQRIEVAELRREANRGEQQGYCWRGARGCESVQEGARASVSEWIYPHYSEIEASDSQLRGRTR